MGRRTAIPALLTALALLAPAACSDGGADRGSAGANPTVATEPPRTIATLPASTTTTNPYAVPAIIDAAYVNRVLAGLEGVIGDTVRLVVSTKTIPPEALDRLKAVYGAPDALQLYLDGLQLDIRSGLRNYRPEIGNKSTIVTELVTARPDCIFVQVIRDYTAVSRDTSAVVNPQWVGLKRQNPSSDPSRYNTTQWAMVYDGFTRDRSQPKSPCAA